MGLYNRLSESRAARNAAASYLAFASSAVCGLLSIPIAVNYLSKPQMGLWSIVFTFVTYLLWLDLGIGNATGRKIAEAIATGNKTEINRWWTLSMGVLVLMGLLVFAIAVGMSALLGYLVKIPPDLAGDAIWLFIGMAGLSAVGMPFRAYPGLLTAQERFHWVPIAQAVMPWLQLAPFWLLLHSGFGIRSYLPAVAISQVSGWLIYIWKVHGRDFRTSLDFGGWTMPRFRELFSYSSSLAIVGIVDSVIQSLPALLLARLGGLAPVAVYNVSYRGPGMITSLVQRTTHSFYPNLQKLFVTGEHLRFRGKFQALSQLGVWVGLVGAGAVLIGNRPLITWLASPEFYVGAWANVWFACAVITIPFAYVTAELFQYSGRMGKSALCSILELVLGVALLSACYRWAGISGLAAASAILPLLLRAPYALYAGSRFCGQSTWVLCGRSLGALAFSLLLVVSGGAWILSQDSALYTIALIGRETTLPTFPEIFVGLFVAAIGTIMAGVKLVQIRKS